VISQRLGKVDCIYPLEPIAAQYLREFPNDKGLAFSMLATTVLCLPYGVYIGMENTSDLAEFETIQAHDTSRCVASGGETEELAKRTSERQKAALITDVTQ